MRRPRQLKRRPDDATIRAAMPKILEAATRAAAEGEYSCRLDWLHKRIRVAVAHALVSRGVRVKDACAHAVVGTTAYSRGVMVGGEDFFRAAMRAAEEWIPAVDTMAREGRLALARRVVAEECAAAGLAGEDFFRNTIAARMCRARVVARLRNDMSIPQIADALGLARWTCYRLTVDGWHTRLDRRTAAGRVKGNARTGPSQAGRARR